MWSAPVAAPYAGKDLRFAGGTVGGSGGTITGLMSATVWFADGTVGGNGGTMTGLAAAKATLAPKKRTTREEDIGSVEVFKVMALQLLSVGLCTQNGNHVQE